MSMKRDIFELFSSMGQGQRLLWLYETVGGESPIIQDIEVDETIRSYQLSDEERQGYVLFSLIPGYDTLCRRFCVLGHAFRSKGYEPIVLRDDGVLPVRPENTVDKDQPRGSTEMSLYRSRRYPELFGLETVSLGDVLPATYEPPMIETDDPDELRSFTYAGVELSGCAKASTRKYLKEYTLDLTDPSVAHLFKQFLRGGAMLADAVTTLLDDYDVDVTVVNEPNYIQGNVPMQICEMEGINVYNQSKGYHKESIIFGSPKNRHYMPQFGSDKLTQRAVETEMSEQEDERLQSLLKRRQDGTKRQVQYTPDNEISVSSDSEYVVGIFSHLLWDGALGPEQALYKNFYDWLDETLEVAVDRPDIHFIVKTHPAEQIRGTNETTGEWVREHYAPLPDNIDLLPPDSEVNTYALINDLDAGIVYASTVGLEMALEGIPVLVGGYPPYHGFGITHDPSSKVEYAEILRNIKNLEYSDERKRRAWRFTYFHFICKHIDFPPLSIPEGGLHLKQKDFVEDDSIYASIVNQILNEEEILQPNNCLGVKY